MSAFHDPALAEILARYPASRAAPAIGGWPAAAPTEPPLAFRPNLPLMELAMDETMGYVHKPLTAAQAEAMTDAADAVARPTQRSALYRDLCALGDARVAITSEVHPDVRRAMNNDDQADAIDQLCLDGDISEELIEKIERVSLQYAARRLRREDEATR